MQNNLDRFKFRAFLEDVLIAEEEYASVMIDDVDVYSRGDIGFECDKLAKALNVTDEGDFSNIVYTMDSQIHRDTYDIMEEYMTLGSGFKLMQCAGFEDCKKELIYGGDILRTPNGLIKEVVWQDGGFGVLNYPLTHSREIELELGITHFASHNMDVFARCEVIGNIYQNKELLK